LNIRTLIPNPTLPPSHLSLRDLFAIQNNVDTSTVSAK